MKNETTSVNREKGRKGYKWVIKTKNIVWDTSRIERDGIPAHQIELIEDFNDMRTYAVELEHGIKLYLNGEDEVLFIPYSNILYWRKEAIYE